MENVKQRAMGMFTRIKAVVFCFIMAISLLLPSVSVLADPITDYATYTFDLRYGRNLADRRLRVYGSDVDFFSYLITDRSNNSSRAFLYAVSFEPFEANYIDHKSGDRIVSIATSSKMVGGTLIYYAVCFNYNAGGMPDDFLVISGFPNLKEIPLDVDLDYNKQSDQIMNEYFERFVTDGGLHWEDLDLESDGVLDLDLEIPRLRVTYDIDHGYYFVFENAAYDLYFELQGRWFSVDDIELYKEDLMWKYKYETILESPLGTWVTAPEMMPSIGEYDLGDLGADAFSDFLETYPVDNRTFSGGSNWLGNKFSGYDDALNSIKMLLRSPDTLYNGCEIYVRYFCYADDGSVHFSKWTHWYDSLAKSSGSSGSMLDDQESMDKQFQSESGLTNEEKDYLEDNGFSRNDLDAKSNSTYDTDSLNQAVSNFGDILSGMVDFLGDFPSLVSSVFGFLPSWVIGFIGLGLAVLIILRIVGR